MSLILYRQIHDVFIGEIIHIANSIDVYEHILAKSAIKHHEKRRIFQ